MEMREVLALIGMASGLVGVYVALDRRVTRMESIEHRVVTLETAVLALGTKVGSSGEAMARMTAELEAQGVRILALEGAVQQGIAQVLAEIRARA